MKLALGALAMTLGLLAQPVLAGPMDPLSSYDFTDSHGDTANLTLQTLTPVSPTGTPVVSITGHFDGQSVAEDGAFGADDKIYSSGPFVDWSGLAFEDLATSASFNLYYTNPSRSGPGELGLCYEAGCNQTIGFYAVENFRQVPEPLTISLFGAGLAGAAAARRRRKTKKA